MAMTKFRALIGQIEALTPMCNFSQPEALCSEEEMTVLVNVTTIEDPKCDEEET